MATMIANCKESVYISCIHVSSPQERFIEEFTKEALKVHQDTNSSKDLEYKDLCKFTMVTTFKLTCDFQHIWYKMALKSGNF